MPTVSHTHIPMPESRTRTHRIRYPWAELGIGHSFFVANAIHERIGSQAAKAGQKLGRKFATRSVIERGVKGIRVWRTA